VDFTFWQLLWGPDVVHLFTPESLHLYVPFQNALIKLGSPRAPNDAMIEATRGFALWSCHPGGVKWASTPGILPFPCNPLPPQYSLAQYQPQYRPRVQSPCPPFSDEVALPILDVELPCLENALDYANMQLMTDTTGAPLTPEELTAQNLRWFEEFHAYLRGGACRSLFQSWTDAYIGIVAARTIVGWPDVPLHTVYGLEHFLLNDGTRNWVTTGPIIYCG